VCTLYILQAPPYHYDNIATITQPPLTPIANSTAEAMDVLAAFRAEHYKFNVSKMAEMGVSLNGTELTIARLLVLRARP
jgi:hypothetical protein